MGRKKDYYMDSMCCHEPDGAQYSYRKSVGKQNGLRQKPRPGAVCIRGQNQFNQNISSQNTPFCLLQIWSRGGGEKPGIFHLEYRRGRFGILFYHTGPGKYRMGTDKGRGFYSCGKVLQNPMKLTELTPNEHMVFQLTVKNTGNAIETAVPVFSKE